MSIETWEKIASIVGAVITSLSIIIAGIWAYRRFIVQQERYPHLNFSADINIIGKQNNEWVVELIACIENKGKVPHKMRNFDFNLNAIYKTDTLKNLDKWGGQVDFEHPITKGSFLPQHMSFFFVDPGTEAKYSFITKIPDKASFAILHCQFDYSDLRRYGHAAEKTIQLN